MTPADNEVLISGASVAGPTLAYWWPASRPGRLRSCAASSPHPVRGDLRARSSAAVGPGRRRRRAPLQRAPAGLRPGGGLPPLPRRLPAGLHPAQLPRPEGRHGGLERPRQVGRHVSGATDRSGAGAAPVPGRRGAPLRPRRPRGEEAAAAGDVRRADLGAAAHPVGAGCRPRLLLRLDQPDPHGDLVGRAGHPGRRRRLLARPHGRRGDGAGGRRAVRARGELQAAGGDHRGRSVATSGRWGSWSGAAAASGRRR